MACVIYDTYKKSMMDLDNSVDLQDDTIKCMLVTSSYTPSSSHDYIDDVNTYEVSGGGYTAGGATLTNTSVTPSSGTVTWDADDITFSQNASGFTNARYAVLYKDTGTASTSRVVCYADLGGDKGNVDGDLTLEMATDGIFDLS